MHDRAPASPRLRASLCLLPASLCFLDARRARAVSLARCASLALAIVASIHATASAQDHAADRPAEADRALATLSPAELRVLDPLLDTGVVSLVEFANGDELPAIVVAAEVEAPPSVVAEVIAHPERYPEFMPALSDVTLGESEGASVAYDWVWRTAIFTLRGSNLIQTYAPTPDHPEMGYRFVVRSTSGDLGTGRTVWRVLPRGTGSLILSSSRMDLRDSNYITRQLASAGSGSAMNRTINLALALSMVLRTRGEAERRAGFSRPTSHVDGVPARPAIDVERLDGLFDRGDVLWMETGDGTDLGRVAAFGRVHTEEARTREAMLDPAGFAQGLLVGAHVNVLESAPHDTRFEWGIDIPLVGTTGEMRLYERADRQLCLDATEGALEGARWRFETLPHPGGGTYVSAWGQFDLSDGLWLIRVVTDTDASMRPGLSAAAELMMIRGLRTRLMR